MTLRFAPCLVALALLGACVETAPACSQPGYVRRDSDGECVPEGALDAGPSDSGANDTGMPGDGGPCDPACTGGEVCADLGGTFECVECAGDGECGARHCDLETHTCVDCTEHAHCTDPEAAQCDEGTCVPCAAPEHCAGTGGGICDTSRTPATCVSCTLGERGTCGTSETCDLITGACSSLTNRQNCETCTNDLQCASGFRCVRMEFPTGTPRDTGHCLRIASPSCPTQHFAWPIDRPSINGVAGTYCGVNEALTTCEAVLALERDVTCTSDAECPDGGLCRTVGVLPDRRCTYPCSAASQCFQTTTDPNKDSCGDGTVGDGMDYCGG